MLNAQSTAGPTLPSAPRVRASKWYVPSCSVVNSTEERVDHSLQSWSTGRSRNWNARPRSCDKGPNSTRSRLRCVGSVAGSGVAPDQPSKIA